MFWSQTRNSNSIPDASTPMNFDEPWVTWLQFVLSMPDNHFPLVILSSCDDDQQSVSNALAEQSL
jgi:hypothetical protein